MGEKEARDAISNDTTLPEELVEVLPSEWNLEDDELPVVPHLKKYFTESAWLIVEDGLKHLKRSAVSVLDLKHSTSFKCQKLIMKIHSSI